MAERNPQAMVVMTQLDFGQYLGEPSYAATASMLPSPSNLKPQGKPKRGKKQPLNQAVQGDFDLLFLHHDHGLLAGEVKAVGANFSSLQQSQQQEDAAVGKKVDQAVKQLEKSGAVLRHCVSDLQPAPRVQLTLMLPFVSRTQLRRVLAGNPRLRQVQR
jgi:hypothetical protein